MKKIDSFTNCYSLSKTLRFKLIPIGATQSNFDLNKMLDEDKKRAENYSKAKSIIDKYHRFFIEKALSSVTENKVLDSFLEDIRAYAELYYRSNKDDSDKASMKTLESKMRKFIALALQSDEGFKDLFGQNLIKKTLPEFLESDADKEIIAEFDGFSTYFTGFFNNRKNMYSADDQSTAISHRCINDNLPKFLDNVRTFKNSDVANILNNNLKILNEDFDGIYGTSAEDVFNVDYFPFVLSQKGIEAYNSILGGYTNSDGSKIKGLNEYIYLYNQKNGNIHRIPKMKQLFKQILSERESVSFIPEKFDSDDDVLSSINDYYLERDGGKVLSIEKTVEKIEKLFSAVTDYCTDGIFVKNAAELTAVCSGAFGYWGTVQNAWNNEYDALNGYKETEKYIDKRKKAYKSVESFSLADIQKYADVSESSETNAEVTEWLRNEIKEKCNLAVQGYESSKDLISKPYTESKKLFNNDNAVELIKNALDSVKELENVLRLLLGTGKEESKDENFYGEFLPCYERICEVDSLYDKVRNYMTQKLYKTDKIKINFSNSHFLSGWAQTYSTKGALIVKKENNYYLVIVDKKLSNDDIVFLGTNTQLSPAERIVYDFQKPDNKNTPRLFIRSKGTSYAPAVKEYDLPISDIIEIYDNEYFKTEYRKINPKGYKEALIKLIDYFKLGFSRHESYRCFNFKWKESEQYSDISEFYNDVVKSCYQLKSESINFDSLLKLVDEGKLYLFQLYNKDFSEHSKGTPNLHTLYFKMLFDERNLENVVFKLNGEAEMFYREASISKDDMIVHPKNQPIKNKNEQNSRKQSTFKYDIVKDRRYTVDQFMLHIPITLNFTANGGTNINNEVRKALKDCDKNYVIGIDRGERNLLYICVVDSEGRIIEQYSLNEIINEYNGNTYSTDYHALLDKKEKERLESRKAWKTVENIKALKEGYISQVVHKICELVEKYDAVIVMEDLNFGFKQGRSGKFEKSVYQKFEKMLIDKLNYFADKKKSPEEIGSVLNAYQLTNAFESFEKMGKQNGFIFYVPAYLTSKIDPTTGFADLLHPSSKQSKESMRDFVGRFDSITFNKTENYFEFELDYNKFPRCNTDYRKKWTVCTYGSRIKTFRNPEKNSEWDNKTVELTPAFMALFEKYSIDVNGDIKAQIMSVDKKDFFVELIGLLRLTLQMRNSETGKVDRDYLISPVKNSEGVFYNSDDYKGIENASLPKDADANGAYNIARKGLWIIEQIKACENDAELNKIRLAMSNAEWLEYAQKK